MLILVTVGGTLSGNSLITYGSSTGTITLSGFTGSVLKWQKMLDSGAWIDISNTTATYSETPSSAGTWQYRAEVQSGICSIEYSSVQTISVAQKSLTITGLSVEDKVADGTTDATLSGTAILSGIVSPDVVILGGSPVANFATSVSRK